MTDLTELKKTLRTHLYDDLIDLLLEFLDPCLDYSVPKCTHDVAFCTCGQIFNFRQIGESTSDKVLVENYCPFCARPNPHKTSTPCYQGVPIPVLVRTTHLHCGRCNKTAESYNHKFCSICQHTLSQGRFGLSKK